MKERKSQGRGGGETSTVLEEKKLNPSETSDNRSFVENAESTGIFRKRDNDHGYHLEQTSTYSTDSQGPLMPILSFFSQQILPARAQSQVPQQSRRQTKA